MYLDICTRADLAARESEIQELFLASYGKELETEEWQWFYLDNPSGPAFVSLYYEGDRLLGHYAVVPITLSCRGRSMVAYRSMTTMVHPDGRGKGLFVDLANRVYASLTAAGAPLVFGFPNNNSAHGFGKHLGWKVLPADRVVDFRGDELLANQPLLEALLAPSDLCWNPDDADQARWRVACPGVEYLVGEGLVAKRYGGTLNVLHLRRSGLANIDETETYRLLVPIAFEPEAMEARKMFDYQFGYRFFNPGLEGFQFQRELILSDVF